MNCSTHPGDHESIERVQDAVRRKYAERVAHGTSEAQALQHVAIDLALSLPDCALALGRTDLMEQIGNGWTLDASAARSMPGAGTTTMSDWRDDRVGSALAGRNPTVLTRLSGGFAVIGDVQFLPGYSVLLADRPGVDRLSDLPSAERQRFLASMDLLGEAVETVCAARDSAFRRVNLEILGNTDDFLHAHVWPRYDWEPADIVTKPVWLHAAQRWSDPATRLGPPHDDLRAELTAAIGTLARSRASHA